MNFRSSSIVKISFTNGAFNSLTSDAKIVDASIGKVAFLDPEIGNPMDYIKEGCTNIINISELSEKQANVAIDRFREENNLHSDTNINFFAFY